MQIMWPLNILQTARGPKREERERIGIFSVPSPFPMPEPLKATAGTTAYSGVNRASHSQRRESPGERRAKKECKCRPRKRPFISNLQRSERDVRTRRTSLYRLTHQVSDYILLTLIWELRCLPYSAWAAENMAELAWHVGIMVELPNQSTE